MGSDERGEIQQGVPATSPINSDSMGSGKAGQGTGDEPIHSYSMDSGKGTEASCGTFQTMHKFMHGQTPQLE